MQSILALVGTGSTLAVVGVGLLEAAAVAGLRDATGMPLWLCLLIVGGLSLAVGAGAFVASKSHVETAVEDNLTVAGQAKQLPWVTLGVAVAGGLILSKFVRWASRGSVVPTVITPPEPTPSRAVPVVSYEPPPPVPGPQRGFVYQQPAPPPRRTPKPPPPRPLFGELGTALQSMGESALSSVLSLGARTLGEKLLEQVFDGGPQRKTAEAGNHDRHRNGSHPSSSF